MSIKPYYKTNNCALYQCDNLELMKQLPDNYIDLIYCDILYGTGRNFGNYQDLKPERSVIDDHYLIRISEMNRLLKETGKIFIHCDYHINHWIRIILDEIFEYKNFINEIIWCYRGGGVSKKGFANKHDTIYCYAKDGKLSLYNPQFGEYSDASKTLVNSNDGVSIDGKERDLERGCHMNDWWTDINSLQTWSPERLKYNTQKPKSLLDRIIESATKENEIVADFYMGCGTTGESAISLGRKFIGCDIGERACKITQERLEKYA